MFFYVCYSGELAIFQLRFHLLLCLVQTLSIARVLIYYSLLSRNLDPPS